MKKLFVFTSLVFVAVSSIAGQDYKLSSCEPKSNPVVPGVCECFAEGLNPNLSRLTGTAFVPCSEVACFQMTSNYASQFQDCAAQSVAVSCLVKYEGLPNNGAATCGLWFPREAANVEADVLCAEAVNDFNEKGLESRFAGRFMKKECTPYGWTGTSLVPTSGWSLLSSEVVGN